MNEIISHLPFVLIYMDDILIFSASQREYHSHLAQVLQILRDHNLYARSKKCSFFQTEAKFLGHLVSEFVSPLPLNLLNLFLLAKLYDKKFSLALISNGSGRKAPLIWLIL